MTIRTTWLVLAAACHAWGPASPAPVQAPHTTVVPAEPGFTIRDVSVRHDGGVVAQGADLHSRDRFEIVVDLSAPAFVYVVRAAPDRSFAVLYPAATAAKLAAGLTRLPTDLRQIFQLDDEVGTEHLYIIATARELRDAGDAIADAVRSIEQAAIDPVAAKPVDKPVEPRDTVEPAKPVEVVASHPLRVHASKPVLVSELNVQGDHDRGVTVVSISVDAAEVCTNIPPNPNGVAACRFIVHHVP
jgi:hypothetical protein